MAVVVSGGGSSFVAFSVNFPVVRLGFGLRAICLL